jgi:polysaccharide pyruvyl transferase WcaK-like protein
VSPCGLGNLGDAAIVDSAIAGLRRHAVVDVEFVGATLNPADTSARHAIAAVPLSGVALPFWSAGVEASVDSQKEGDFPSSARAPGRAARLARRLIGWLRSRLDGLPRIRQAITRLRVLGESTWCEASHIIMASRLMRRGDALVVSGGGQLDSYWGGTWGQPYALFKWTGAARLAGKPVVFLSVGAGRIRSGLSTLFLTRALRRAAYRSYRDVHTRAMLGRRCDGPLVPDLAFGHPRQASRRPAVEQGGRRVGISPMAFKKPKAWPESDQATYTRYVDALGGTVASLGRGGRRVEIFCTDRLDRPTAKAVQQVADRDRDGTQPYTRPRVSDTGSVEDVVDLLQAVEVVVATRLHAVILALMMGRPVLAVSYDWKVSRQMEAAGLGRFVIEVPDATTEVIVPRLEELIEDRERISALIRETSSTWADQVDAQYEGVVRLIASWRSG